MLNGNIDSDLREGYGGTDQHPVHQQKKGLICPLIPTIDPLQVSPASSLK